MQKTLNIVAKDLRHLWPETLLTLAITFGFAATEHFGWPGVHSFREADTLRIWMNVLLPIAWWLLIARAVHDESLVGDRQFWITRPYGWPRVLAAKLLLIALVILLPFFAAQCFLLHQAGLHPTAVLPGLLLKLVWIFAFILLSLLALASVTATLTRMLIIYLALILYIALTAYFISVFGPNTRVWTPGPENPLWLGCIYLIPLVAAGVVLLQYARRTTRLSVTILLALVAILTVAGIGAAHARGKASAYLATPAGQPASIGFAFDPDPALQPQGHAVPVAPQLQLPGQPFAPPLPNLSVPLNLTGVAPDHAIRIDGYSLSYRSPDGSVHGTVSWTPGSSEPLVGNSPTRQTIPLPRPTFLQTAGKSLILHLTYAVSELVPVSAPQTILFDTASTAVPQNGRCTSSHNPYNDVYCQYALRSPDLTRVVWHARYSCITTTPGDLTDERWIGGQDPNYLDFSPIATGSSLFGQDPTLSKSNRGVCPKEPVTFTRYRLQSRHLIEVTLPPIDPQKYLDTRPGPFLPQSSE